jgi:hypothetical protein
MIAVYPVWSLLEGKRGSSKRSGAVMDFGLFMFLTLQVNSGIIDGDYQSATNRWAANAAATHALSASTVSMRDRTSSTIEKPTRQQITNNTQPDHSKCWKCSPLCPRILAISVRSYIRALKFLLGNISILKVKLEILISCILCKASKGFSKRMLLWVGAAQSVAWPITGWTTGVLFPREAGIFLFATESRPALVPTKPRYCHVSGVPWRIITGSGLDDWIYWHLLCSISLNHNQLQELTINLQLNLSSLTAEDSLHSRYRSTIDFSSAVTDLVLIYESVTSELRMTTELTADSSMNASHFRNGLLI